MSKSIEFFNVQPVQDALDAIFAHWQYTKRIETLDTRHSLGRVLASAVHSPIDLPQFSRSSMDGYAVRAEDTYGASQSLPAYLMHVGHVMMGVASDVIIEQGQVVEIHTGGMVPSGANAVVMVERTQSLGDGTIEILSPVAVGENVIQVGEDIEQGKQILPAGHCLRPQDIGGLLAVGIVAVDVVVPPHIGILSCGDELVPPESTIQLGQIRDINSYTLAGLMQQIGAQVVISGIARDNLSNYQEKAQAAFADVDMLIMTAGSSVSSRDLTREVINNLGKPGVLQHGLAVKPGKPTILAVCDNKPVIGLPGNPVSALLVARQIVVKLVQYALGESLKPIATVQAVLGSNIASTTGREDSIPVALMETDEGLVAQPIFGKSNLIFVLVEADGLIHIPLNSNGLRAGGNVEVMLF